MKKFALLTTPFLCIGAAALFADAYEHSMAGNAFGPGSGLLVANDQASQNGHNGQKSGGSMQQMGQITPEAEPKVTRWADPFITGEFIYWKAVEENIHYAFTGVNPNDPASGSVDKGRVESPDSSFQPGFKLGFGLRFKHDGWDLYGNWTWLSEFKGSNHCETDDDGDSAAFTTLSNEFTGADGWNQSTQYKFENGHANWSMRFNALDLELGRNFYISPYLTLRPHFGLKFGWIDQDYHAKYKGGLDYANGTGSTSSSRNKVGMEQDFFGVGIRTGLDTVWYFTKHWGIYGDFAFSALWSDFHSRREDNVASATLSKAEAVHYENKPITLTEVLELGLGLRYDTTFFIGDYAFYLQAGWEEQIWFNQNQFFDNINMRTGNLTMHGLTVKAGLVF